MPYLGNVPSSFNVGTDNINNDAITTAKIADGAILNADVNAAAAIAGTKISPDFGSQTIATTGIFSHALGSVSAPTITFTGDLNTGIWSPAADTIAFSEGGVEAMRIDTSGRLGIGTTSPQSPLVVSNGGAAGIEIRPVQSDIISFNRVAGTWGNLILNSANNVFQIQGGEVGRFDNSGRLLVGTSTSIGSASGNYPIQAVATGAGGGAVASLGLSFTPDAAGYLLGGVEFNSLATSWKAGASILGASDGVHSSTSRPSRLVFFTTADGASSPTERMRISSTGLLSIPTIGNGTGVSTTLIRHDILGNPDLGTAIATFCENSGINAYGLQFLTQASYLVSRTTKMYISAVGDFYLSKTSGTTTGNGIYIVGSGAPTGSVFSTISSPINTYHVFSSTSNTYRFYVNENGGISNFAGNNINLSDEREKKNIANLKSTWDCLKHWELKEFNYNEDSDTESKRYGVIAQQIAPHCPEVISTWTTKPAKEAVVDDDGIEIEPAEEAVVRLGVKEQQMYWMAIKALQEAQVRIEQLEARLTAAGIE